MKKFALAVAFIVLMASLLPCHALAADDVLNESFEEVSPGMSPMDIMSVFMLFDVEVGTPNCNITATEEQDNIFLRFSGYTDLRSVDLFGGEMRLSADFRSDSLSGVGMFVRGVYPGGVVKVNPKNQGVDQVFHYYEWDWYAENGGSQGPSGLGGSGIGIFPTAAGINVVIKKYEEDGLTIRGETFSFELDCDFTEFTNISVTEKDEAVTIYVAGEKVCTIALPREETVQYESDGAEHSYIKTATVFDKDGAELGVVENTRVSAEKGQIAFTSRSSSFDLDNISLLMGEGAADAVQGGDGDETEGTHVTTEPATENQTEDEAEGTTVNESEDAPDETGEPESSFDDVVDGPGKEKNNTGLIIGVAAGVAVVIILAALFIPKKK